MTNGDYFEGNFERGLKEGQGKMTFAATIVVEDGIWYDDKILDED